MITLPSKTYTADAIRLSQILGSTTKANMLKVCKRQYLRCPQGTQDSLYSPKVFMVVTYCDEEKR